MPPENALLGAAPRLEAATAQAVIDRCAETGLIDRGAVAILSVAAIRQRAGERWPRKAPDVHAYVARRCAEHLSTHDMHHRLNDTDFLVAMTAEPAAAVQAAALRILEEVLNHFLGAAETPDVQIQTVTAVGPRGELASAPLDPRQIARAPIVRDEAASPYRQTIDPIEERRRNPVSFVSATGKALQVGFAVEPVASLRHQVTAALRISPTVSDKASGAVIPTRAYSRLEGEDLAAIDRATISFGTLFLAGVKARAQPALILPVSFQTMGARKGRALLTEAAGERPDLMKASVMCEFIDVDRGTPAARLIEVSGLVTSLCRGVMVRIRPAKDMIAQVRGFRPHALSIDVTDAGESDDQAAAYMLAFGEQAKGQAQALMAFGLPNSGFFAPAQTAGLTHAAVRPEPATAKDAA